MKQTGLLLIHPRKTKQDAELNAELNLRSSISGKGDKPGRSGWLTIIANQECFAVVSQTSDREVSMHIKGGAVGEAYGLVAVYRSNEQIYMEWLSSKYTG